GNATRSSLAFSRQVKQAGLVVLPRQAVAVPQLGPYVSFKAGSRAVLGRSGPFSRAENRGRVLKIMTMAGKSWSCFQNHDHGWKIMVLFRKSRSWLENHGPVSKIMAMAGKSP